MCILPLHHTCLLSSMHTLITPCRSKVLLSFLTGWVLLLGQCAFTASNTFTLVSLLAKVVSVMYGEQGAHLCISSET